MESYRAEVKAALDIALLDQDGEIGPVPTSGAGKPPEPELDPLSVIVNEFNQLYGAEFGDADRVIRTVTVDMPAKVSTDRAYRNAMRNSDRNNARIESDLASDRVANQLASDDLTFYKLYVDDESFRKWVRDKVFALTYGQLREGAGTSPGA